MPAHPYPEIFPMVFYPPAIRPWLSTGVVMPRAASASRQKIGSPTRCAGGPPNFQPSGPLSSIQCRPQDGLTPLPALPSEMHGHFKSQTSQGLRPKRMKRNKDHDRHHIEQS
jgi:hypothetical protein